MSAGFTACRTEAASRILLEREFDAGLAAPSVESNKSVSEFTSTCFGCLGSLGSFDCFGAFGGFSCDFFVSVGSVGSLVDLEDFGALRFLGCFVSFGVVAELSLSCFRVDVLGVSGEDACTSSELIVGVGCSSYFCFFKVSLKGSS